MSSPELLYLVSKEYMASRFIEIDKELDLDTQYLPTKRESKGALPNTEMAEFDKLSEVNKNVREIDPDVVFVNNTSNAVKEFKHEYPTIFTGHGVDIKAVRLEDWRDDLEESRGNGIDLVITECEKNQRHFKRVNDNRVEVAGMPEFEDLVGLEKPETKTFIFAPTNFKFGRGCFVNVAEDIVDEFANTEYNLIFNPHPYDRTGPARETVEKCREKIQDIDNIEFADDVSYEAYIDRLKRSDVLISDYSGSIAAFLYMDRPIIQIDDIAHHEYQMMQIGEAINSIELEHFVDVYENGYSQWTDFMTDDPLGLYVSDSCSEKYAEIVENFHEEHS